MERSGVLCNDLAVLRLEKEMTLKLQVTKTSVAAFMAKTEFKSTAWLNFYNGVYK